jgi:ABC-2 type transport system permease protein
MPLNQIFSYIWLGQATFAMLPWMTDPEARAMMRTGNVGYELLRPVDIHSLWLARALALRSAPTLLRGFPLFVIALVFLGLEPPASAASGLACAGALIGALALSAAFTVLAGTTLFWTISGEGITQLLPIIVPLLSGNILPLPLFPDWTQPLLAALPFRGMMDAPFRLYTGHIAAGDFWAVAAHQWVWVAALILAGRWMMQRGLRQVVVQGG